MTLTATRLDRMSDMIGDLQNSSLCVVQTVGQTIDKIYELIKVAILNSETICPHRLTDIMMELLDDAATAVKEGEDIESEKEDLESQVEDLQSKLNDLAYDIRSRLESLADEVENELT